MTDIKTTLFSVYETIRVKLQDYPSYLVDVIFFAPLGFVIGFILSSFGRYLFFSAIVALVLIWVGSYFDFIHIDQALVRSYLGVQSFHSLGDFFTFLVDWMREHIAAVIALFIGFILGWKCGL